MRRLALAAAALLWASGCAHERSRFPLSESSLGASDGVPLGLATGEARSLSILGRPAAGDDAPETAARRARGAALEAELADATVERRLSCFPSCRAPLVKRTRTVVSGTLIRPFKYRDREREAPPPSISPRAPKPAIETLRERLLSLHGAGPEQARAFYANLDGDTRAELRDFVLATSGRALPPGDGYRVSDALSGAESRFAHWFIREFTSLRLEP